MIFKIAFRNMLRQRRRTALTLLTVFGGFTLAAISIGWSDGTYAYIIDMFTSDRLGQIEVHKKGYLDRPSLYDRIQDYQRIGSEIRAAEGVESWAPRVYSSGLASRGEKTAGVQLIGMDPDREESATGFSRKVVEGRWLSGGISHEVLLGKGLARILGAHVGDELVLVTQAADGSIANDVYRLRGIVETGDENSDRLGFYLTLADAQQLLVIGNDVHEIVVMIHDLDNIESVTQSIRRNLNDSSLEVQPWQEFARSFYQAMKADQQGMWIMLFIIMLIVAVGVLNTVLMSVLERRREYGLLKAMGTRPGQIAGLVLAEVIFIGLLGAVLGAGLSSIVNWALSIRGISLSTPITYGGVEFGRMYTEISARSLYIPAATVIVSALVVAIVPALNAARTEPAKAMRTF